MKCSISVFTSLIRIRVLFIQEFALLFDPTQLGSILKFKTGIIITDFFNETRETSALNPSGFVKSPIYKSHFWSRRQLNTTKY